MQGITMDAIDFALLRVGETYRERVATWEAVHQNYNNAWYRLALSDWDQACLDHNRLIWGTTVSQPCGLEHKEWME